MELGLEREADPPVGPLCAFEMATRTNLPQAHAMDVTKEEGDGHFSSEQASPLLFGVHAVATSKSLWAIA